VRDEEPSPPVSGVVPIIEFSVPSFTILLRRIDEETYERKEALKAASASNMLECIYNNEKKEKRNEWLFI